jgi:hypothetical protein
MTRDQLQKKTRLSSASITNHIKWLQANQFLEGTLLKKPHAYRPIEELFINPSGGMCLAIRLAGNMVYAELVKYDMSLFETFDVILEDNKQSDVIKAFETVASKAFGCCEKNNIELNCIGVCVYGDVISDSGIISKIQNVPDWQVGEIRRVVSSFERLDRINVWTLGMCKLVGFALDVRCDTRIGYVYLSPSAFCASTMQKGIVVHGRSVSSNTCFHMSLSEDMPVCFCGRKGCVVQYLMNGNFNGELARTLLEKAQLREQIEVVGIELTPDFKSPQDILESTVCKKIVPVCDSDDLAKHGLRELVVETGLRDKIKQIHKPKRRVRNKQT